MLLPPSKTVKTIRVKARRRKVEQSRVLPPSKKVATVRAKARSRRIRVAGSVFFLLPLSKR